MRNGICGHFNITLFNAGSAFNPIFYCVSFLSSFFKGNRTNLDFHGIFHSVLNGIFLSMLCNRYQPIKPVFWSTKHLYRVYQKIARSPVDVSQSSYWQSTVIMEHSVPNVVSIEAVGGNAARHEVLLQSKGHSGLACARQAGEPDCAASETILNWYIEFFLKKLLR